MGDREVIICSCHSPEHQAIFYYLEWDGDPNDTNIYMQYHLSTHDSFFKRLWAGIKYAFGYKSRYGFWDELLMEEPQVEQLRNFLNKLKESNQKIGFNTK